MHRSYDSAAQQKPALTWNGEAARMLASVHFTQRDYMEGL